MQYKGRFYALGIVILFNILRYYYQKYFDVPNQINYLILAPLFLLIPWWAGKQYDLAKFYSEIDPLTNTYNRRIVKEHFLRLEHKVKKENGRIGIVMIDINNFKGYNDTYGHDKGDQLLIEFASLLKQHASKHDLVARWGGDEFLLIVPNITENFKSTYIADLHTEFKKVQFIESTTIKASVGIAIYPKNGETLETLINAADIEMYNSKKAMKNNSLETVLTY
jgi:diguanylate cyclase (GGDEF)-like protein